MRIPGVFLLVLSTVASAAESVPMTGDEAAKAFAAKLCTRSMSERRLTKKSISVLD